MTTAEYASDNATELVELFEDAQQYQRMIGKLLYLTITRPDIAYIVQTLSQFMQRPKVQHWNAALRALRYIKTQPGLGLLMSSKKDMRITGYCDANWASCPNTRRFVTRYILKLGHSLIAWKSKKQATITRSSAEAEYRSLAGLTAEVVWVTNLAKELDIKIKDCCKPYVL
ncbi:secreted RxLR effector protein 161-like [Solanum dulcamara]|uniref:secreted RxLR effector protein 161-like n=1 Tax=Solanum dulcamara TaxID=45834 RepID=UPI0024850348|nr:secreted RxLR effector protein 161-like [Solanum dulcamara]